jgi:hypothetical protein
MAPATALLKTLKALIGRATGNQNATPALVFYGMRKTAAPEYEAIASAGGAVERKSLS